MFFPHKHCRRQETFLPLMYTVKEAGNRDRQHHKAKPLVQSFGFTWLDTFKMLGSRLDARLPGELKRKWKLVSGVLSPP